MTGAKSSAQSPENAGARSPLDPMQQLRRLCDDRERLEAQEAKGSAELYWLWKTNRVERQIWLEEVRVRWGDALAGAARAAGRGLRQLLPACSARADALTSYDESSQRAMLTRTTSDNLGALSRLDRVDAECARLESEALDMGVPATNHEASLALLQFEETVLMDGVSSQSRMVPRTAAQAWPSQLVRLEEACRALESEITTLRHDASLIEAYVVQIEKIGASAPYSSELQSLLTRCQELALRHQLDLPGQKLPLFEP